MISQQLTTLIGTIPKVDVNYSLEFISNVKKFEDLPPDFVGKFRTESTVSPKESTPPPTLPGMPPLLNNTKNTSLNGTGSTITSSVTASSPISLPTSMQSSFDGDISGFSKGFSMMSTNMIQPESPTPPIIPSQLNVPPVTSMVEYNLQRLASMVENSAPDMNDSILPQSTMSNSGFLLDDMLNGEQMLNNLQALAKIGDMTNGSSMNSLGMMDTYGSSLSHASTTSPILQTPSALTGINDDIKLSCFSQFRSPDAANGTGRAKATPMQIRVKFGALGPARGQFNSPHGFCLGLDEEIIVADTNNHRIEVTLLL
jgi:tripartite motif-containing protein 2/3